MIYLNESMWGLREKMTPRFFDLKNKEWKCHLVKGEKLRKNRFRGRCRRSLVRNMLNLRCVLDVQVEGLHKQLAMLG